MKADNFSALLIENGRRETDLGQQADRKDGDFFRLAHLLEHPDVVSVVVVSKVDNADLTRVGVRLTQPVQRFQPVRDTSSTPLVAMLWRSRAQQMLIGKSRPVQQHCQLLINLLRILDNLEATDKAYVMSLQAT